MAGGIDGVGPADTAEAGDVGDRDVGHVFHQHRDIVVGGDDDIVDLTDIVEQADAADDIGLVVADDEVTADIDIAFTDGVEDVEGGDAEVGQLARGRPGSRRS